MAMPDYKSLMNRVLSLMADNKTRSVREIVAEISLQHSWTDEEPAEMLPSGSQTVTHSRIGWAVTHEHLSYVAQRNDGQHIGWNSVKVGRKNRCVALKYSDHVRNVKEPCGFLHPELPWSIVIGHTLNGGSTDRVGSSNTIYLVDFPIPIDLKTS